MDFTSIEYSEKDHIGIINIKDNDIKSTVDLLYDISEVCSVVSEKDNIYIIVITGIENSFLSAQAGFMTGIPDSEEAGYPEAVSIPESISNIDKPVIAAVDGEVYDMALEILLACDLRLASVRSRFGFQLIKNGLIPGNGGTQRLARLIGKARALEMLITGMVIDAAEAYSTGLISKMVSSDEIGNAVMEIAREITNKGPVALRYAKEAVNAGMDLTLEQGLRLEADLYMLLHTSQDREEGIKAFRGKRKALFQGK